MKRGEKASQDSCPGQGEKLGKGVSVWPAVPDHLLDFNPHEKTNPIRTILVHQGRKTGHRELREIHGVPFSQPVARRVARPVRLVVDRVPRLNTML